MLTSGYDEGEQTAMGEVGTHHGACFKRKKVLSLVLEAWRAKGYFGWEKRRGKMLVRLTKKGKKQSLNKVTPETDLENAPEIGSKEYAPDRKK